MNQKNENLPIHGPSYMRNSLKRDIDGMEDFLKAIKEHFKTDNPSELLYAAKALQVRLSHLLEHAGSLNTMKLLQDETYSMTNMKLHKVKP